MFHIAKPILPDRHSAVHLDVRFFVICLGTPSGRGRLSKRMTGSGTGLLISLYNSCAAKPLQVTLPTSRLDLLAVA
jgi:hypothetical protein